MRFLETSTLNPDAPPVIALPFRFLQNCIRNDQFLSRHKYTKQLDTYFFSGSSQPNAAMQSVVIHGLGGCGKSSVANFEKYRVILWLYADTASKLDTQCINLARVLGIKTPESHAREAVLQWINHLSLSAFSRNFGFDIDLWIAESFLIVFDNADDPSILAPYWPNSAQGFILVTSRNPTTREEGFARHGLHLKAFHDNEGVDFLISLLDNNDNIAEEDLEAVNHISQRFGGLPLALCQAAAFIRNKRYTPAQFTTVYQCRFNEIDWFSIPGFRKPLVNIWQMSMSTCSEHSLILLDTVVILDPDSIPMEFFHSADVEHSYGSFMKDSLSVLGAIEGLANQSLVDYSTSEPSQIFPRGNLPPSEYEFRQIQPCCPTCHRVDSQQTWASIR